MHELALFAGAGGGILGTHLAGIRTVAAVEIDPYCREVLLRRQDDGVLPMFPIWDDVRTFNGTEWRGVVDIVTGGFPCQDISTAGKGAGINGDRSGLWNEMYRIVREVEPSIVFVENSPALIFRGLGRILGDLATLGYDAIWGVFSAADVGAQHQRERMWILAYSDSLGTEIRPESVARRPLSWDRLDFVEPMQYATHPGGVRSINGMAYWVDRVGTIGNGQVPAVVRFVLEAAGLTRPPGSAKGGEG